MRRLGCLLTVLLSFLAPLDALAQEPIVRAEDIPPPHLFVLPGQAAPIVPIAQPTPIAQPILVPQPVQPVAQPSPRELDRMRRTIRHQLAARRRINLARFRRYVARREYPVNSYQPGALNVMIDEQGHICAAATIMSEDGLRDLVRAQAQTNNFVRLADVHDGALYEWMLGSGFTQEELATIQEPFFYVDPEENPVRQLENEKDRLRARYQVILGQLERDREQSIDLATERLLAHRLGTA